jgi:fluoroacetyl-CoA thioesterase
MRPSSPESDLVAEASSIIRLMLCGFGKQQVNDIYSSLKLSIRRCSSMGLFARRENMKETLHPGIEYEFTFTITEAKTVAALYPEASDFQAMPDVFATGFLVGLIEWTCIQAVNPFLDWPEELTVGTHINISHLAATPPGFKVTAKVRLVEVDGRRLVFEVEAHDGVDLIARGSHERFVINQDKFNRKMKSKAEKA